ncbi:GNAT family N-acetyltransferase [Aggregicoccus sp. 17bor-14]|uniref:GNAT family N-acetyltransferase n=1 Tax=Myxococcaceae TaxID=31 RepID=UPI00129C4CC5|nr:MULTISPECIES: GNAT family N-acetyltransferase [Myxococcaceae]MBF5040971.1 GNAT family N-acetyltransferase [Simulacricoccus sp. 17bor-14]MRI86759.1 GNAT family N-acetyltransferase [Aggregicoccus sp. 17bor-14]
MPPPGVSLRPIAREDAELLCRIYASTRTEELAQVPWPQAQKDAFLRMQFEAQHAHYQLHYADAAFHVVMRGEQPVGRLYVHRRASEIRIVDISLLPEQRGTGLGTALLQELQEEARAGGRILSIHVERTNPALSLYRRLGFQVAADDGGVYLRMEWSPGVS